MSDGFAEMLEARAQNNRLNFWRDLEARDMENVIYEQQDMIEDLQAQLNELKGSFVALRNDRDGWEAKNNSLMDTAKMMVREYGLTEHLEEINNFRRESEKKHRQEIQSNRYL